MSKEPETIKELFFFVEGKFNVLEVKFISLENDIKVMRRFSYWITGIVSLASTTIFLAACKILKIL